MTHDARTICRGCGIMAAVLLIVCSNSALGEERPPMFDKNLTSDNGTSPAKEKVPNKTNAVSEITALRRPKRGFHLQKARHLSSDPSPGSQSDYTSYREKLSKRGRWNPVLPPDELKPEGN